MNKKIVSGKEILDNFFNEIEHIPNINLKLASMLKILYQENKFTDTNLSNKLSDIRSEEENAKN